MENKSNSSSCPTFPAGLEYQPGFGNHFSSEAIAGALPKGQNSPLVCPFGLYAEQISGTSFTAPRKINQRSWLYRIKPSVTHEPFKPRVPNHGKLVSEFNQSNSSATPTQLRWKPVGIPEAPTDFIDGMYTVCGAGSSYLRHGYAIHMYTANKSMDNCAFCNADGDFLIVPQKGKLWITTECGRLQVSPGEVVVLPQGFRFAVNLPDGPSRGYVSEVFGTHFQLPDLGPIGANGLAEPRDFLVPTAWFEERVLPGFTIVQKYGGELFTAKQDFSPFNAVAWHGNYVPYKYDLSKFCPYNTVLVDHGDPSINLASRLNLTGNIGSGNLSVQGPNRMMSGVLQQASPQVISMLGNSYPTGGPLSQNHVQAINNIYSMGMLNDLNSNDGAPFDLNDFPQLMSRPSSAGGPQGQLVSGSLRKQSLGVSPIVQQNQEFSIQNEDFPALPGFKGGNAEFSMDMHQKVQLHDNTVSMMQPQHFSLGRSAGFNSGGFSSHRPQHQQQHSPSVSSSGISFSDVNNQDLLHMHGSDLFPSSHSTYHSQTTGTPGIGLRPINSPNTVSGMGSYDQLIQQYQQHQNPSQFRLQQISAASQSYKSMHAAQAAPDPFGLLGLLSVIRMSDPDLTSLALGIDLTTLGLNLNSAENLHKAFGSPWSNESGKGDPEFTVPQCYYAKQPPSLHQGYFSKFQLDTLFYIFYSMPRDEAQLYAANELYNRGWFYHREQHCWFTRVANMEPLVKTNAYERGSYICFDPNTWETIRKENFVVHYDMLEKRPALPQH